MSLPAAIALRRSFARNLVVAASKNSVSLAVLERGVEVAGPAREPVRLGQLRQLCLIAADQDRVGHHQVAVLERDAALRADGENRADQMLVHAHAAGDAVHDDAEPVLRHFNFLSRTSVIPVRAYQVNWKSARAANSVLPSPLWGGSARSAGVGVVR